LHSGLVLLQGTSFALCFGPRSHRAGWSALHENQAADGGDG